MQNHARPAPGSGSHWVNVASSALRPMRTVDLVRISASYPN